MLERFLGAARGADLVAPELHLQAQALERVGVVLDDQDAVALAQRSGASPSARRRRLRLDQRQPEDELAALARRLR